MVRCDRCIYERDCSPLTYDGTEWMVCDRCRTIIERRAARRRLNHE